MAATRCRSRQCGLGVGTLASPDGKGLLL
jgi:hypothetical protein